MAEKFKSFFTIHIRRKKNAHADALVSFVASLALPAGATTKVLVFSHDLYYPKSSLRDNLTPTKDLQAKEVLETLASLEFRNW